MIDAVKEILLRQLSEQQEEYRKERESYRKKVNELNDEYTRLKYEQSKRITVRDDFSFFERWFTRRREYKMVKERSKRLSKLPQLIIEIKANLDKEHTKAEDEIKKSGIEANIREIEGKIWKIEEAKTLWEMELSPTEAIELLEREGIQPVLSESDKTIFSHSRDYSSKSSLIGVHKTKYPPTANMIRTSKDSNVEERKKITINGVEYEYSYKFARDTVHVAMNDEVSSHAYGSWDDCKYAILIPFEDIPNEKIGRAAPMDTFTRGSIELSENTWVLCPKNEVDRLKAFNPKVHVLGYDGASVQGFSQPFLTQLGYRAEDVHMWGWTDKKSQRQFYELMKRERIKTGAHTYTHFHEDERMLTEINQAVSLCILLRDNHLISNPEDIEKVTEQLEKNCQGFGFILSGLGEKSSAEKDLELSSIKGNHKQVDIFLEEMKKNGFNISNVYQDILRKLCEISIYDCNETNGGMVFSLPEEVSEEEQRVIGELKATLATNRYINPDIRANAFGKFLSSVIGNAIIHSHVRDNSDLAK